MAIYMTELQLRGVMPEHLSRPTEGLDGGTSPSDAYSQSGTIGQADTLKGSPCLVETA